MSPDALPRFLQLENHWMAKMSFRHEGGAKNRRWDQSSGEYFGTSATRKFPTKGLEAPLAAFVEFVSQGLHQSIIGDVDRNALDLEMHALVLRELKKITRNRKTMLEEAKMKAKQREDANMTARLSELQQWLKDRQVKRKIASR